MGVFCAPASVPPSAGVVETIGALACTVSTGSSTEDGVSWSVAVVEVMVAVTPGVTCATAEAPGTLRCPGSTPNTPGDTYPGAG